MYLVYEKDKGFSESFGLPIDRPLGTYLRSGDRWYIYVKGKSGLGWKGGIEIQDLPPEMRLLAIIQGINL